MRMVIIKFDNENHSLYDHVLKVTNSKMSSVKGMSIFYAIQNQ